MLFKNQYFPLYHYKSITGTLSHEVSWLVNYCLQRMYILNCHLLYILSSVLVENKTKKHPHSYHVILFGAPQYCLCIRASEFPGRLFICVYNKYKYNIQYKIYK